MVPRTGGLVWTLALVEPFLTDILGALGLLLSLGLGVGLGLGLGVRGSTTKSFIGPNPLVDFSFS